MIVRTLDDNELDKLLAAGATEVVPEVLEGSLMLASHSLLLLGVPLNRVLQAHPRDPRGALQPVPRLLPRRDDDAADAADNLQPRLHSVLLPERARAVGRTLASSTSTALVEVTGVRRRGHALAAPGRRTGASRPATSSCCSAARGHRAGGAAAAEGLSGDRRGPCAGSCRRRPSPPRPPRVRRYNRRFAHCPPRARARPPASTRRARPISPSSCATCRSATTGAARS